MADLDPTDLAAAARIAAEHLAGLASGPCGGPCRRPSGPG